MTTETPVAPVTPEQDQARFIFMIGLLFRQANPVEPTLAEAEVHDIANGYGEAPKDLNQIREWLDAGMKRAAELGVVV